MKIAMLVMNPCVNDARVIRQAEALAAEGHDVTVLATWKHGLPADERLRGVRYLRPGGTARYLRVGTQADVQPARATLRQKLWQLATRTARRVSRVAVGLNLLALLHCRVLFSRQLRALRPEAIHAHELHTLLAGWLYARRNLIPLVYDSHELEVGRNGRFLWHERRLRQLTERFLIRRCAAVITVCDSIADYLRHLYGIPRPLVVHNAPEGSATTTGNEVKTSIGLSPEIPLAVYVGSVTTNRGIEAGVSALVHLPALHLALVGPRNPLVASRVTTLAHQLGVADRLHLVDPVPHTEVMSFIRTADLSLVLIQDTCLSYAMCFPNKLLESLLARVPVIASDLVELRRIVGETAGGIVVDQTNLEAIADAMGRVLADRANFVPNDKKLDQMVARYGWATQRARLVALYRDLAGPDGGGR